LADGELGARGLEHARDGRVARLREEHAAAVVLDLAEHAVGDAPVLRVVRDLDPATRACDADGEHVVALAVDRAQHPAGGDARDGVLPRHSTEEDEDPRSGRSRVHRREPYLGRERSTGRAGVTLRGCTTRPWIPQASSSPPGGPTGTRALPSTRPSC